MTLTPCVMGIDPGLVLSHAILIAVPEVLEPLHAPRYTVVSFIALTTPEDEDVLPPLLQEKLDVGVVFVAVESARGVIITGRAADPVLRNATMSGRLQQHATATLGVPVGSVPALGTETGWNWRGALGCAGMNDEGVRLTVRRRLDVDFPPGKRGGKVTHWVDAAGVAVATLDRLLQPVGDLPGDWPPIPEVLRERWHALSKTEVMTQQVVKDKRAGRREGRALRKRFT